MASDQQTAEVVLRTTFTLISSAHWKLNYYDWLQKIGAEDDDYWKDKWQDWLVLVNAVNGFDPHTLSLIVS
jgi:hypothetical protein